MQASVEKIGSIGRKVSVVVPADKIESAVQGKLKQLSKTVKMQGFRPGKVPMRIVEQQYRGSATYEVMDKVIQETLQEALIEQDLIPAVQPDIEPEAIEKGKDFTYHAVFDVYPEFSKLDLDGIKISKPESSVEDKDVDTVIETMRKQQITWNEVERAAKKEDRVMIDFAGTVDGEAFDGGSGEDHPLVLGEGRMLADFEAGIEGMKAGESKDVPVAFPEDYQAENLAGKEAVFKIDVKTVSESELPEINEEFIKSFGIESGDVADLRAEVTQNLENNLESQLNQMMRSRAFDAIVEQNEVDVPEKMVREEAQRIVQEQKNQLQQQGIDPSILPEPEFEVLEPQAKKRVLLGLVVMEIVRKLELKPDEDRVNERIEKMASTYQSPDEFIEFYKTNQQALQQVQSLVLEEQVVDKLLESAEIEVETLPASELLNI